MLEIDKTIHNTLNHPDISAEGISNMTQNCSQKKSDRNIVLFVYNMILTGLGLSGGYHFLHTGLSSPV